jgi:thiaminase/transcriptional activator TenA
MSYGKTFPLWRAAAGTHWEDYTRHAFVEQLADGTLPRAAYVNYLVQDYLFLIHFSRAWALAIVKAQTVADMRFCADAVHALINEEISLHVKTCEAEGIPESDLFTATEKAANVAYTRYVLDAGYAGDFLDLMAVLAPCVMGYGEIGARLGASASSDAYAPWIEMYSGDEYQGLCSAVGDLIDNAIGRGLGDEPDVSPRWAALCHRFTTATRLEVDFWEMGLKI